jgi:hypothetical protein
MTPILKARLDVEGTAQPLTRLVAHVPVAQLGGRCNPLALKEWETLNAMEAHERMKLLYLGKANAAAIEMIPTGERIELG